MLKVTLVKLNSLFNQRSNCYVKMQRVLYLLFNYLLFNICTLSVQFHCVYKEIIIKDGGCNMSGLWITGSWNVHVCCLHLKMELRSCDRGCQWCGIIHYY